MIKKLLIFLLVLVLAAPVIAPTEPLLGELPDWSKFPQPVGLWLFNEGSGNKVYDLSGNGNYGTLTNNAAWSVGTKGRCIKFNSNDDYVLLNRKISYGVGGIWTIVFWANKRAAGGGSDGIVCGELGTADNYIFLYTGNYLRYVNTATDMQQWTELTDFTGWHQYAIAADNNTEKLYRDGVYIAAGSIDSSMEIDVIGAGYSNSGYDLDGKVFLFMIFDFALSASEIAQLYRDPFPWFKRVPIWMYKSLAAPPAAVGQVITVTMQ